jgi:hypothetical protein
VAVIQNVKGVVAVDLTDLSRTDGTGSGDLLKADSPGDGADASQAMGAELLMLDPDSIPQLDPM